MAVGRNDTSFHHYTTEWIRKVNHGALFCINDHAYKLFYRIEQEVRIQLPQQLKSQDGCKEELIDTIASNDEVQFKTYRVCCLLTLMTLSLLNY